MVMERGRAWVVLAVAALCASSRALPENASASSSPSGGMAALRAVVARVDALAASHNAALRTIRGHVDEQVQALQAEVKTLREQLQVLQGQRTPKAAAGPPLRHGCFASPPPLPPSAKSTFFFPSPGLLAAVAHNDTLHAAALRDDADALHALLIRGADTDERDAQGDTALHAAAQAGHSEALDVLLFWRADPRTRGRLLRSPLHLAAAHGQLDAARHLVEAGAQTGARDARGATALALAAQANHSDVFEFLLQKDASAEYVDEAGDTALLKATREGRWARAEELADGGAAAAARGRDGVSPLLLAARNRTKEALGALRAMLRSRTVCDAGEMERAMAAADSGHAVWAIAQAVPELVAGSAGEEALRQTARDGRREALGALLAAGVDSEQRSEDGNTALQLAASGGHTNCFAPLLQALPSTRDKVEAMRDVMNITTNREILEALGEAVGDALTGRAGLEALKEAGRNGKCDIVRTLLAVGLSAGPEDLREPLEAAAVRGFVSCVQWLREAGAPPLTGLEWEMRLRKAAEEGRREALVALLATGVSVDATDELYGRSALMFAAWHGHGDCVTELLMAGADKERKDTLLGYTPLLLASWMGRVDVVKVLLAADVNVNAASPILERSPLMEASSYGHSEVVEELLAANAYVNATDVFGKTALHFAAEKDQADVVRLLLRNGADKSIKNNANELPLYLTSSEEVRRLLTS